MLLYAFNIYTKIHATKKNKNIEKNKILKLKHLTSKRPGTGISPILLKDVIGKRTKLKIEKDTILEWEMLN